MPRRHLHDRTLPPQGRGWIPQCLAHQLPWLLQRPRAVCDAAVVRAVVPAHERARLLTMGGDVRAVAACLHQHARRQLQHELPPQEGQPLPELAELLTGLRPADRVHDEPGTGRDLSACGTLVTWGGLLTGSSARQARVAVPARLCCCPP